MPNNPDFNRSADEVIVPPNPQFGWIPEPEEEKKGFDALQEDLPVQFTEADPLPIRPALVERWHQFQLDKGRYDSSSGEHSCDLSLVEEFILSLVFHWLPQLIGSCVISNTFRGYVHRTIFQKYMCGQAQDTLGATEFSPDSIAPFAPWSYGQMRRRGGLRGRGDGGFCNAMIESLMKDGVIPCSTPKLKELMDSAGATKSTDYPECQSTNLYRAIGDGKWENELAPFATARLTQSLNITKIDTHHSEQKAYKPIIQCSMIAIKKKGNHPDGFTIHTRDNSTSWAHNMEWMGFFYASDGELFDRLSNESWGKNIVYNIPRKETESYYTRNQVTSASLGNIALPAEVPTV